MKRPRGKMARCPDCYGLLVIARLPNRGVVWAHQRGGRKRCDRIKAERPRAEP
jgi:hypothetical protein